MARIAVDFDDTLVAYNADGQAYPIEGAAEKMRALMEAGHEVIIYTCRTGLPDTQMGKEEEIEWIAKTLEGFGIPFNGIFPGLKLVADVYIDDRAIAFEGEWKAISPKIDQRLEEIQKIHDEL